MDFIPPAELSSEVPYLERFAKRAPEDPLPPDRSKGYREGGRFLQDTAVPGEDDVSMPPSELTEIPNIGPAVARKLERLDVHRAEDLRGRDPHELFERLCALDGRRHDPCLLDTFVAAVDFAGGGEPRPWWEFSRERKAREDG